MSISKSLEAMLLDSGCSDEFIEYATNHAGSYNGDLPKFIDFIEHLMDKDSNHEAQAEIDRATLMDSGSKRVEHDYTGDNLRKV